MIKIKKFVRPTTSIVLAFVGAILARVVIQEDIFVATGWILVIIAFIAFGLLGFILPELVQIAARAGLAALARQMVIASGGAAKGFGLVGQLPFVKKHRRSKNQKESLIVDTSVLIDGRIADIIKTGFIGGEMLVIPSVLGELHKLADSADELRRVRGKRGLEILTLLKKEKGTKLEVLNFEPDGRDVDDKLVVLSKKVKGKLLTVDYNLNRVAGISGVKVLNINELANALKTVVLPSERLEIRVSSAGNQKDQGVGYLADGTMVVVEDGAGLVGKKVWVVVHRVLQTAAGKMIFARAANGSK